MVRSVEMTVCRAGLAVLDRDCANSWPSQLRGPSFQIQKKTRITWTGSIARWYADGMPQHKPCSLQLLLKATPEK